MRAELPIILVVDDQVRARSVLVQLLEPLGFELMEAEDGASALKILETKVPDLMLLDVMMPDLDGYEVCRRARAIPQCAEIPIIMTTGLDDREAKLKGLEAGADEFLTKPIDGLELRSRVKLAARLNRFRKISDERNRLALLFNQAPHAIFLLTEGRIVSAANDAARRLFEMVVDDLENSLLDAIVETASLDRVLAAYDLVLSGRRKSQDLQAECRGNEGMFTAAITIADFSTKSQRCVQVHIRDIGNQGELENELLRSQRLQGVGTVATGIAHDMINILTPISISMQAIKASVKDGQQKELIDCMEDAAKRGIGLLDQMLGYTKSTGKSFGKLQADHVVDEIGRIVRPVVPAQVEFSAHTSGGPCFVNGDATQIHQICLNLSLNAIEAVGTKGQVDIICEVVEFDELSAAAIDGAYPGDFVKIQVTDDGHGIPPEIRSEIFQPFSSSKTNGGGLGLYTVAQITRGMGGFLQVMDREPGGTSFAVYLPRAEADFSAQKSTTGSAFNGNQLTVLLYEGNADMRSALKFNLEQQGIRVDIAEDGADMLHRFIAGDPQFSLIICSARSDGIDGTELIRVCRKARFDIPAILLTAESEVDKEFPEQPPTILLTKPFSAAEFSAAIQSAFEVGEPANE